MKKLMASFLMFALLFNLQILPTYAQVSVGDVVITEVAWAGSQDSSGDEWVEFYNTTDVDIDLSGWKFIDDGTEYLLAGMIPAKGYFLVEDNEDATSIVADQILNLSFANSGDALSLLDQGGTVIDSVNSSGGAWFAGDSVNAKTMERVELNGNGDQASNWLSNVSGSGEVASAGSFIEGTPKTANSVTVLETSVNLVVSNLSPAQNSFIDVLVSVNNVDQLFSYGFDLIYDPTVLNFTGATKASFLSENDSINTSFQAGLENQGQGKLLIAESRLLNPAAGITGSGDLFTLSFQVVGAPGMETAIAIGPESFLANEESDIIFDFENSNIDVELDVVLPVTNLTISESLNRYELLLNWDASLTDVDEYEIYKKSQTGAYELVLTTNELSYIDAQDLVPNLLYDYRVVAVKNGLSSVAIDVQGLESRGLKGDNDRSDRVDGRDLQRLAKHFAESIVSQSFDQKIDTNYDGLIDGVDLFDLAANFGLTY